MFLHLPRRLPAACSRSRRRNALRLQSAASAKLETNPIISIHEHNGRGAMLLHSVAQTIPEVLPQSLISLFDAVCGLGGRYMQQTNF